MNARASPAQVVVRRAIVADAPRIAELSGQLGYPTSPEEVAERLGSFEADARHAIFVAALPSGEVIGWVHAVERQVLMANVHAEVAGLVVAEGFRGCGAGTSLIERAEQWARSRGCTEVLLRSNVFRVAAHEFYKKRAYATVKTQKVFRKDL
ncbi:MAG TPA: GNAT family N-acetyltransferase [Candidatus Acidoferrales bacterium]|nr:GNAT family N-acetyltransferase [Candidatus Acidoferrales bacterium]